MNYHIQELIHINDENTEPLLDLISRGLFKDVYSALLTHPNFKEPSPAREVTINFPDNKPFPNIDNYIKLSSKDNDGNVIINWNHRGGYIGLWKIRKD